MRYAIDHSLLEVLDLVIILNFVNERMDSTQTSRRYVMCLTWQRRLYLLYQRDIFMEKTTLYRWLGYKKIRCHARGVDVHVENGLKAMDGM